MSDGNESNQALVKRPGAALQAPEHEEYQPSISAPVSQTGFNHLAMNVVVPGLGTMVRGRRGQGAAQLGLFVAGIPVVFLVAWWLGLLMMLGGWGWSVATGIGFLRQKSGMDWS